MLDNLYDSDIKLSQILNLLDEVRNCEESTLNLLIILFQLKE